MLGKNPSALGKDTPGDRARDAKGAPDAPYPQTLSKGKPDLSQLGTRSEHGNKTDVKTPKKGAQHYNALFRVRNKKKRKQERLIYAARLRLAGSKSGPMKMPAMRVRKNPNEGADTIGPTFLLFA